MQLFTQLVSEKSIFSAIYYISPPWHLQVCLITTLCSHLKHWKSFCQATSALIGLNSPDQPPPRPPHTTLPWAPMLYLWPDQSHKPPLSWCWCPAQPWPCPTPRPGLSLDLLPWAFRDPALPCHLWDLLSSQAMRSSWCLLCPDRPGERTASQCFPSD